VPLSAASPRTPMHMDPMAIMVDRDMATVALDTATTVATRQPTMAAMRRVTTADIGEPTTRRSTMVLAIGPSITGLATAITAIAGDFRKPQRATAAAFRLRAFGILQSYEQALVWIERGETAAPEMPLWDFLQSGLLSVVGKAAAVSYATLFGQR
jgi:hypothetical protein